MKFEKTTLQDVLIIQPIVHGDPRGFFIETFHQDRFCEATQTKTKFIQDNHSRSAKNVLRGLHLQTRKPQGKLIRAVQGAIFDVVVDLREHSKTFCQWEGFELSAENFKQLWVPPGFAHGFLTQSDHTEVVYKVTDEYDPEYELTLSWNDPELSISWPIASDQPKISNKDAKGLTLSETLKKLINN